MGKPLTPPPNNLTPPQGDLANIVVTGSLTATGTIGPFPVYGDFNVALWGTFTGSVHLQKTFDGGTTYIDTILNSGSVAAFSAPGAISLYEPEKGVAYILNATTLSSGTLQARFSASGPMAQSSDWR